MEKIYLVCSERGMLKVACRAVFIRGESFFDVKEVDEQRDEQEEEKRSQDGKLTVPFNHFSFGF